MLLFTNQIYSFITILALQVDGMVIVRDNSRRCSLVPNQFNCMREFTKAEDGSTFRSPPVLARGHVNEFPQMYEQDYADTNYYADYPPAEYSESDNGAETMDAVDSNQRLKFDRSKQVPSTELFFVNVSTPVHSSDFISKLLASAKKASKLKLRNHLALSKFSFLVTLQQEVGCGAEPHVSDARANTWHARRFVSGSILAANSPL
ncbi:unnamed protein product [Cylicocyclus nassatus]|uniref:Uncharacterized protein n=1 Tax=Cylicocyclus nassatus TaxID=53992 RepID=A0AA36H5Z4_CYLNA|nr:unnamed protein product [Cylicocyclus nassatus]